MAKKISRKKRATQQIVGVIVWAILWTAVNTIGFGFYSTVAYFFGILPGAIREPYVPPVIPVLFIFGMFGCTVGCLCGTLASWGTRFLAGSDRLRGKIFYGGLCGLLGWWTGIILMALHLFGVWNSFFSWNWVLATAVCVGIVMMIFLSRWGDMLFGGVGAFGRAAFIGAVVLSPRMLLGLGLGYEDQRPKKWEPASPVEIYPTEPKPSHGAANTEFTFPENIQRDAIVALEKLGARVEKDEYYITVHLDSELVSSGYAESTIMQLKTVNNLFLVLNGPTVTNATLEPLKGLNNVEKLSLHSTKITDGGLVHLEGLSRLKYLYLDNTQITDSGLQHLEKLTNLQLISLRFTQVTDEGVEQFDKALPTCVTIL